MPLFVVAVVIRLATGQRTVRHTLGSNDEAFPYRFGLVPLAVVMAHDYWFERPMSFMHWRPAGALNPLRLHSALTSVVWPGGRRTDYLLPKASLQ